LPTEFSLLSVEGTDYLGGLAVGGRTVIKLILKKWNVCLWASLFSSGHGAAIGCMNMVNISFT
jgi:hypothetical protein